MVVKEASHSPHATAISLAHRALTDALGAGWYARAQMPVALDDERARMRRFFHLFIV